MLMEVYVVPQRELSGIADTLSFRFASREFVLHFIDPDNGSRSRSKNHFKQT